MVFTTDVLKVHKAYTEKFWLNFGDNRPHVNKYKACSRKSKTETIAALIELGEIKLVYKKGISPEKMRRIWNKRKDDLKKYTGFKFCFACKGTAQCRHHIIWIKNGGRNIKKNIVPLCNNCHAEIHPWLKQSLTLKTPQTPLTLTAILHL